MRHRPASPTCSVPMTDRPTAPRLTDALPDRTTAPGPDLSRRRAAGLILALPLALGPVAVRAQAGGRTVTWAELVPPGWDPYAGFKDLDPSSLREGSAEEQVWMQRLRQVWDEAPLRQELDGQRLRLPGYVVPLDTVSGTVREFLLVPYYGACVHSPPPPANQIVHVTLPARRPLRSMDAVWVSGEIRAKRQPSAAGVSGYVMDASLVQPYRRPER